MKTKHTPGPWTIEPDLMRPTIKAGTKTLGWLTSTGGTELDEAEANAHLIGAAPDLLASVQELRECLSNWMEIADEDDEREYDRLAIENAVQAVAKAEGR